MPEGNHNMSDSACRERAQRQQEHELLIEHVHALQQQVKLLFKLVRSLEQSNA